MWGQKGALVLVLKGNGSMCRGRRRGGYPPGHLVVLGQGEQVPVAAVTNCHM